MFEKQMRWWAKNIGKKFKHKAIIMEKKGDGFEVYQTVGRLRYVGDSTLDALELYDSGEKIKPPEQEYVYYPNTVVLAHYGGMNYAYLKIDSKNLTAKMDAADKNWLAQMLIENKRDFEKKSWWQENATIISAVMILIGGGLFFVFTQYAYVEALKGIGQNIQQNADTLKSAAETISKLSGIRPPT